MRTTGLLRGSKYQTVLDTARELAGVLAWRIYKLPAAQKNVLTSRVADVGGKYKL